MEDNPYEAPKSHITLVADQQFGIPIPAGKGVRFVNMIIDYAAFFGFSVAIGFLIGLSGNRSLLAWVGENETLAGLMLMVGYYVITEGVFARSVGKLITGCKVVNEKGERPSFGPRRAGTTGPAGQIAIAPPST